MLNKWIENRTAMSQIKPLGNRVLLKRVEEDEQVKGGIIIPDSAKEKPQEAEVVALGTGKKDDDGNEHVFTVSVGDRVLTSKYGGTDVKIDDVDFILVDEDDILGIVE
jgi:chaperonin GroES